MRASERAGSGRALGCCAACGCVGPGWILSFFNILRPSGPFGSIRFTARRTTRSGLRASRCLEVLGLDAAGVAGVAVVELVVTLAGRDRERLGVHDDHVVAGVHVRARRSACACRAAASRPRWRGDRGSRLRRRSRATLAGCRCAWACTWARVVSCWSIGGGAPRALTGAPSATFESTCQPPGRQSARQSAT